MGHEFNSVTGEFRSIDDTSRNGAAYEIGAKVDNRTEFPTKQGKDS